MKCGKWRICRPYDPANHQRFLERTKFAAHFRAVLQATYARTARMDARPHEKTFETWA